MVDINPLATSTPSSSRHYKLTTPLVPPKNEMLYIPGHAAARRYLSSACGYSFSLHVKCTFGISFDPIPFPDRIGPATLVSFRFPDWIVTLKIILSYGLKHLSQFCNATSLLGQYFLGPAKDCERFLINRQL